MTFMFSEYSTANYPGDTATQQPSGQPMQMYDPSAMATSQASHTPGE